MSADLAAPQSRTTAGRTWGRRFLIGAVLAWFALLILVPAAALLTQAARAGLGPMFSALAQPEAVRSFALSLGITLVAVVLNLVFGIALALVLARQRFFGRAFVDGLLDLPFAVSPVVAGLMLIVLYGPDSWIGGMAQAAGFRIVYALPAMLIATLFVTLPFVAREVIPVLDAIGTEQEQAAATLGAGRWPTFWRVTLPSIRWAAAYGVTLTAARSLGEFGAVLVVSGNLIGRTQTATLYVHDAAESFRPEGAYAASLVLGALSVGMLVGMESLRKRLDGPKEADP